MGVTNLEGKQDATHVKNVALFALGAIEAVEEIYVDDENPKQGHVHLRIGFHSGRQTAVTKYAPFLASCLFLSLLLSFPFVYY